MFSTDANKSQARAWVIALLVFFASALYSFYYHDRPRVDAAAYDKIGWNVARGLGYVEDEANAANPRSDEAIIRVGPGYQFFLAGIYTLVGHYIPAVWLMHALLRASSVLLVFYIARLLMPGEDTSALLAAGIFGFMPDLIVINGLLLSETLFIALTLVATYFSLRVVQSISQLSGPTAKLGNYESPSPFGSRTSEFRFSLALVAGFFWALAILTRPVALLPFGLFLSVLLWKKYFAASGLAFLFPLILVGSWSYYASTRYDSFILTTTVGGYDLWVGNNPGARGGFEKTLEIQEARQTHSSVELDTIGKKKYFEFLFSDPLAFAELQLRKTALYFSLMRPGGYWMHLTGRLWHLRATLGASFIATALLFVLGLAGGWRWFQERREDAARIFLAFAILAPLAVIPIIVETRYRYPFYSFLAIFTAYFIASNRWRSRALWGGAAFILALAAYDFFSNSADILEKISRVLG